MNETKRQAFHDAHAISSFLGTVKYILDMQEKKAADDLKKVDIRLKSLSTKNKDLRENYEALKRESEKKLRAAFKKKDEEIKDINRAFSGERITFEDLLNKLQMDNDKLRKDNNKCMEQLLTYSKSLEKEKKKREKIWTKVTDEKKSDELQKEIELLKKENTEIKESVKKIQVRQDGIQDMVQTKKDEGDIRNKEREHSMIETDHFSRQRSGFQGRMRNVNSSSSEGTTVKHSAKTTVIQRLSGQACESGGFLFCF